MNSSHSSTKSLRAFMLIALSLGSIVIVNILTQTNILAQGVSNPISGPVSPTPISQPVNPSPSVFASSTPSFSPSVAPSPSASPVTTAQVTSFSLINAKNGKVIKGYENIGNGSIISLSKIGTHRLNIRANTNPQIVTNVHFTLKGYNFFFSNFSSFESKDSSYPYTLFGAQNGKFLNWTPIKNRSYKLTATPFVKTSGNFSAVSHTIFFTIVK